LFHGSATPSPQPSGATAPQPSAARRTAFVPEPSGVVAPSSLFRADPSVGPVHQLAVWRSLSPQPALPMPVGSGRQPLQGTFVDRPVLPLVRAIAPLV